MRAFLIGGESVLREKKKGRFLRFLRLGLMVLLLLIAAVITYLVVILVHPQREEGTLTASPAPFSTPGSGYVLESADQVPELLGAFPGPVLLAADSSPLQLLAGQWEDRRVQDGYARCLTLVYELDSVRCTVQSIAPGSDPALYDRGAFHLVSRDCMIAGRSAAAFENGTELRVQLTLDGMLYSVTLPLRSEELTDTVLRSLAFSAGPDAQP